MINSAPARLFTNKKEVIDPEAINKFTYNFNYFKNKQVVADYYKNDTFIFVSNSFIKYSGINEWRCGDTLTYTKSGTSLQIKSEVYRRLGNAFLPCNLPVCHINKWDIDSIDYIYNGMAGPDISAYVFNTRYEVFGFSTGATSGNVSVYGTNSCGNGASSSLYITVNSIGQPGSITGPPSACQGKTYPYSIASVPGATYYTWTLPPRASGSSSTNSISVTFGSEPGYISVTACSI